MTEMCHPVGIAASRRRAYGFATKDGFEGRQVMNSFTLGKLAEFHIQSLVDGADEGRNARRADSKRSAPRRKHRFHWHKKVVERPLTT
jgi:hypothetical protein